MAPTEEPSPERDGRPADSGSPDASDSPTPARARSGPAGFLSQASRLLAESLDYEETLVTVAGMALPYLGSWCIVDVVEENASMRRVAIVHPDPGKGAHTRRLEASWPPQRDDPLGAPRAIEARRAEVIPRVTDELLVDIARSEENLRDLRALAIGSVLVVPLLARGNVLGAITFVSADTGPPYGEDDVALAEDLAARCAMALDNASLYRAAQGGRSTSVEMNERLVVSSMRDRDRADAAREANEAKSSFLAAMSHEFRNPLNAITGYADLIEEGIVGPVTPGQEDYLRRIRAGTKHLVRLIEDVLDLAKVEAGQMHVERTAGSVTEVIEQARELMEPQAAAAAVALETGPAPATPLWYLGDQARIRQVLVNLLSNAVKFTDEGGRVTVTSGRTTAPHAEASLPGDGPWVFIAVEDTGIGIAPEDAAAVFQPFARAQKGSKQKRPGTGLGLAISRELARRMSGDLTVRSVEGEGSCFTLWLPAGTPTSD